MNKQTALEADQTGELADPFEAFFDAQRPRLFRALLLVTHDRTQAEDLMQDAFVRVWERWDRVGRMEDPEGYLFRTAMNLNRSAVRRLFSLGNRIHISSLDPDRDPDPFEEVAARDEAVRALAALTPRQRAAIIVTELLGYRSEDAARILGIRPGTVRTLTSQAKKALAHEDEDDA